MQGVQNRELFFDMVALKVALFPMKVALKSTCFWGNRNIKFI